jgi:hypothetical protein
LVRESPKSWKPQLFSQCTCKDAGTFAGRCIVSLDMPQGSCDTQRNSIAP